MLHKKRNPFSLYIRHKHLVFLFLPALAYYLIFHYGPIYGIQIAFKDYKLLKGMFGSSWVGLENFKFLFELGSFWEVFRNTLIISVQKLAFGFPAPIIFAIVLNEIRNIHFKKTVQTLSYLPHFLSWVVLAGFFLQFLSPSSGPINIALKGAGLKPVYFIADPKWFRTVLVTTKIWKEIGWGSIVYLAALSGIDPALYEAAGMDGASRFQKAIHITLPSLIPIITIMLILSIGRLLNDDFDQILNLYNPAVYKVGDVLSTYTYRVGLIKYQYSLAAAVGVFRNAIGFLLIIVANWFAKRMGEYGIW
jgi:putative aldouronate transport system permease protein